MDFLDRLDSLMRARGINKNKLSKESGIPYTTIDGLYKKGYENTKLSTVRKLCAYFGVSMDYLVGTEHSSTSKISITDQENQIILAYRQADQIEREMVHRILEIEDI